MPSATFSDSSSEANQSPTPLKIWIYHDKRAGHLSQLEGLINALAKELEVTTHWFDAQTFHFKISRLMRPQRTANSPDIVIGAGHKTHKSILFTARAHKALSFVVMKPSLPLSLFDGVICPQHDDVKESERVCNTQGPITKISPPLESSKDNNREHHLMMIGGPSKHFEWNTQTLVDQIQTICLSRPDISWSLSSSPRTPAGFIDQLNQQHIPNLECHTFQEGSFGSVEDGLRSSAFTWITPDSMSMIYESLSAGSPTALFKLTPSPRAAKKRICRHVSEMIEHGTVIGFDQWYTAMDQHYYPQNQPVLDEAAKAARWLLERYRQLRPL